MWEGYITASSQEELDTHHNVNSERPVRRVYRPVPRV